MTWLRKEGSCLLKTRDSNRDNKNVCEIKEKKDRLGIAILDIFHHSDCLGNRESTLSASKTLQEIIKNPEFLYNHRIS